VTCLGLISMRERAEMIGGRWRSSRSRSVGLRYALPCRWAVGS